MNTEKQTLNHLESKLNNFYSKMKEYTALYEKTEKQIAELKSRPMSSEEYQKAGYYTCPICRSEDVFQVDLIHTCGGDIAQLEKECETCGAKWEERYDFSEIIIFDDEDLKVRGYKYSDSKLCRCGEHIPNGAVSCIHCGAEGSEITNIALEGSKGILIVDTNGDVVDVIGDGQWDYSDVVKVDWEEFKNFYEMTHLPKNCDILAVRLLMDNGDWLQADPICRPYL